MSSSTGPYQSKFLNFLNRQTNRLKDQCDRAVRAVKVATVWGVQVVLYPIYLAVQTARFAGHQLQQATQHTWLQLQGAKPSQIETPPPTDTPIQRVLTLLDAEVQLEKISLLTPASEVTVVNSSSDSFISIYKDKVESLQETTPPPSPLAVNEEEGQELIAISGRQLQKVSKVITGVASLLTTRKLVLVTVDYHILDILTPEQQQKLQQRISLEISDYWRVTKLVQGRVRKFTGRVPISPEERSRLLPPVRLFWLLMAWVQFSPVALAANLFKESSLITSQNSQLSNQELEPSINPTLIAGSENPTLIFPKPKNRNLPRLQQSFTKEQQVAKIAANPLQPVSELTNSITQGTQTLLQRLQGKNNQAIAQETSSQAATTRDNSTTNSGIDAVIRAAIDYFFGQRSAELSSNAEESKLSSSASKLSGMRSPQVIPGDQLSNTNKLSRKQSPTLPSTEEEDPWLSWGDIFPNKATPKVNKQSQAVDSTVKVLTGNQTSAQLPSSTEIQTGNSITKVIKRYLKPKPNNLQSTPAADNSPLVQNPSSRNVTQSVKTSAPVSISEESTTATATEPEKAEINYTPDWIETQATSVGYVKHPLETLLGWLDKAMLWFEQQLIKAWQSIFK
ncbi:MAG TPA: hypothetical protein V6D15_21675 [Oculatellaceae cyanobacterium]